jgi:ribosomal protein L40E
MVTLRELGKETAFLKMSIYGFAGSGKTRTAAEIAAGMHQYIKSEKPVVMIDTETGSDFIAPIFQGKGIKFMGVKSRSFADLISVVENLSNSSDVLIVDSLTHIWTELQDAYRRKKYACYKCGASGMMNGSTCKKCDGTGAVTDKLALHDFAPIKREWGKFVDLYLNSKAHIILCGRAGFEYISQETLEGKLEIIKGGTKMRAEGETNYESSLVLEMRADKDKKGVKNVGFVWKDRASILNGQEFTFPKFEDFLPHINSLNLGGAHVAIEPSSSVASLQTPQGSNEEYSRLKTIALEEIQALLLLKYPSSGGEDKRKKLEAIQAVFNTHSWTAVESLRLEEIQEGIERVKKFIESDSTPKTEKKEKI